MVGLTTLPPVIPDPEATFGRTVGLAHARIDGVTVVHSASDHSTHVLDDAFGVVWAILDEPHRFADLVESAADLTDTAPDNIEAQVGTVLEAMQAKGLVRRLDPLDELADEAVSSTDAPPQPVPGPTLAPGTGTIRAIGGTSVVLHSPEGEAQRLLDLVAEPLPPLEVAEHEVVVTPMTSALDAPASELPPLPPALWRVDVAGRESASVARRVEAVDHARGALNQIAVDHTPGRLLFHAGAVELDGRVVVVTGASGAGKSTVIAALVRGGFAYLTDEMVAIHPEVGTVDPYPKLLDLTTRSLELLDLDLQAHGIHHELSVAKVPVSPKTLGEVSSGGRVGLLVLLDHPTLPTASPDVAHADVPEQVGHLIDLLDATFAPTMRDPGALEHLAALLQSIEVLRLPRLHPSDAVARIRESLARGD